jgi:hypothetical protein
MTLFPVFKQICRHVSPSTEAAHWAASVLAYPNLWQHKQPSKLLIYIVDNPNIKATTELRDGSKR